jgi:hypothetical protein
VTPGVGTTVPVGSAVTVAVGGSRVGVAPVGDRVGVSATGALFGVSVGIGVEGDVGVDVLCGGMVGKGVSRAGVGDSVASDKVVGESTGTSVDVAI